MRDPQNGKIVLTEGNWERMAGLGAGDDKPYRSWFKYVWQGEEANAAMKARTVAAYKWRDYPAPKSSKRKDEALDGLPI